jgi:hypothetical protein
MPTDSNDAAATDYLVEVPNAKALDLTLRLLPGCTARVVGYPEPIEYEHGRYRVRVFGNPSFFLSAMRSQGYCRVVEKCASLA